MSTEQNQMRPIWYFVGWILISIGGIVILSGIYNLFFELPNTSVMEGLHPNLWWGTILLIVGIIYAWKNKDIRNSQ